MHVMDYNPYLKPSIRPQSNNFAGANGIEEVDKIENIVWQTRSEPPTEYENQLGDAMENVFDSGAEELPEIVAKLNELGSRTPDRKLWTEENFQVEMKRLGA
jgi:hypothetical protein